MINSLTMTAAKRVRAIAAVISQPPYANPGHFYSPLTSREDIRRAVTWRDAPGVDLNEKIQLGMAASIQSILAVDPPGPRYRQDNNMFGASDAAVYRAMLNHLTPSRIVEVGSGFSTALALDEASVNPALAGIQIACIEPYPERLLALLKPSDPVTLLRCPIQSVPIDYYSQLGIGDVLFIDSSHVAKAGSDVTWLLLHVMPRLAPGVVVHIHDVFWPFTYPAGWLRERRDWNEAFFVHAFLAGNVEWEILLFSSWLWKQHPESVPAHLIRSQPGSIWLRKKR